MKAEFLQNFKLGDASLPKEAVDAILAENARDVEEAKKPFADYESIKGQLQTAREGLEAFQGVDVKDLQGQVAKLTKDLKDKEAAHQVQLADLAFDGVLKDAITAARGRSDKAIRALLDVDALKASKDQGADIKAALEGLKKDNGYLFEADETPPPYAAGTGTGHHGGGMTGMDAIRAAAGLSADKK
ncbi:MAG: hypothetical protein HFF26_02065 [Oscillospiraceae bacterium]|nr:hypothetical protein [Oscillospiraceae bacterium]